MMRRCRGESSGGPCRGQQLHDRSLNIAGQVVANTEEHQSDRDQVAQQTVVRSGNGQKRRNCEDHPCCGTEHISKKAKCAKESDTADSSHSAKENELADEADNPFLRYMLPYQEWKKIPGLHVNEHVDYSKKAVSVVERCRSEFWQLYKHARVEEEKRVKKARAGGNTRVASRPDRVAESQMLRLGKCVNQQPILGHIPGIKVNDEFQLRSEALVVGLHRSPLAGIVWIPKSRATKTLPPVATSVVVGGMYEDDSDMGNSITYTGEGGNNLLGNRKQISHQTLTRGNEALAENWKLGIPVRLLKKNNDKKKVSKVVFRYDGLWDVVKYYKETGKEGYSVWKFQLERRPGQEPSKSKRVHYRMVNNFKGHWEGDQSFLICNDISRGLEALPIPVVNAVDSELAPSLLKSDVPKDTVLHGFQPIPFADYDFCYSATSRHAENVHLPPIPTLPPQYAGDPHVHIRDLNHGTLPYEMGEGGVPLLISPMSIVIECGPWCHCLKGRGCPQAVSQMGLRWKLQIFKTVRCGWGVRALESIPRGAFITTYHGDVVRREDVDNADSIDDTYFFDMCKRPDISDDNKELKKPEEVDVQYVVDGRSFGNFTRFVNHSCNPNLFVQPILSDHLDRKMPKICLFTMTRVAPGQELTYDYGMYYVQNKLHGKCHCGARHCVSRQLRG
ncbi:unnamed protein product [Ostreobium quekettii]|uniref:Uncharacterized protein n=1 Tax=Ostreobium quekettii TaxID=121088 RepID=A0A8S1JFV2_9CHLO|nr:unnamed protein product [Ostreobium quekettii]|eukprot:evm.model.scf_6.5 EVM.evm.TU.scf_6.5   scf_6:235528-256822(+)